MTSHVLFLIAFVAAAVVGATRGALDAWHERLRDDVPLRARIRRTLAMVWGWCLWAVLRVYATTRPMITAMGPEGEVIFHRWFLTSRPEGGATGTPGWYLHHLTAPDYDRREHDHPWGYARTRVLRGWYVETRDGTPYTRCAADSAVFVQGDYHRITHVRAGTWTLFYAGAKHGRGWGFRGGPRCELCGSAISRDPKGLPVCGRCITER